MLKEKLMQQKKYMALFLSGIVMMTSCTKRITTDFNNPNNPESVPAALVLGTVLNDMSGNNGSSSIGSLGGVNSWDVVHGWNQYHCQNYDYYGNNVYSWTDGSTTTDNAANTSEGPFNSYLVLKNVVQMEQEVLDRGGSAVNPYEAIGRFLRAYYYYNMTMLMGDVPLTQALSTTTQTPSYTPQEQVFAYVLAQLDTANAHFATLIAANDASLSSSQDIYYGGVLSKWQKLVNSFELRVLVELSPKASDATLNVPARFAAILGSSSQYPIFTSQSDDFQYVYNPGGSNTYSTYPFNPSNFGSIAGRFNMAYTYVNACTSINDPRVFMTCEPAWALVGTDTAAPAKYAYFMGASTGLAMGTMYANASANDYSFIGRYRYYSNFTGDPDVIVGYKEMLFNIAEGIERGWWNGATAESYYKQGIQTSMAFYGIKLANTNQTAYFLPPGANAVTQVRAYPFTFDWSTYYAQSSVQLSATQATAINEIVYQKYIAMFETSGYEPYYNWRRTGIPAFQGGSGVGNNGIIPIRWAYPTTEQTQNGRNWSAALSNQGFSADDLNQKIWLLK